MNQQYADREMRATLTECMALLRTGVNDRRRGAEVDYRPVIVGKLHRSIARQAQHLGVDATGWFHP